MENTGASILDFGEEFGKCDYSKPMRNDGQDLSANNLRANKLDSSYRRTSLSRWRNIGGLNTVRSYGVNPARSDDSKSQQEVAAALIQSMPESHRRFLQGLAVSFSCGDFFFAHAGVRPGVPLQEQSQHDLLWIRDEFLLYEEDFGKIVVHGHTPAQEPEIRANRINIDTGAYATGRLTCLVLEHDWMGFL